MPVAVFDAEEQAAVLVLRHPPVRLVGPEGLRVVAAAVLLEVQTLRPAVVALVLLPPPAAGPGEGESDCQFFSRACVSPELSCAAT